MTSVVAGLRGTGDFGTDERPKNFRELILKRNPNGTAPFTALMARMKKESVDDAEFAWWDEPNDIIRLQMSALVATTSTTFTVDSLDPSSTAPTLVYGQADHLVPGDLLQVENAGALAATYAPEIIAVSSVTNSTTFVAKRGQAGTTPATIGDDTFLTKLGSAFAEGTGAPSAATRNPTKYFNLCQIFKTIYDITGTTLVTKFRTGDPLRNDKARKMWQHAAALEMQFLWGVRNETTGANGKPLRYCGGLRTFIPAFVFTTTPTAFTFLDNFYQVFDYDTGAGDERIVFAGNGALNSVNKLAVNSGQIHYVEEVKLFGMTLSRWRIPQGSLLIRTHPLMNRHSVYTNSMFIVDPTSVIYRPLRDTRFKDNIQLPDEDRQKGQWMTEAGIEVQYGGVTNKYIGNFVV